MLGTCSPSNKKLSALTVDQNSLHAPIIDINVMEIFFFKWAFTFISMMGLTSDRNYIIY